MTKRAMLLGLLGLGVLGLGPPAGAQGPDSAAKRAERIRTLLRDFQDVEAEGRARVLRQRGLEVPRRPAVQPAGNVETFEPVTARYLRFSVRATSNGAEPCLHRLEITGPDGPANLTEVAGVRLTASSV